MAIRCLFFTAAVSLLSLSCAKGPPPVKPGTPAFFWSAANQAYRTGDFLKTRDALVEITSTENEYTSRARVWMMVVASGLAQGYAELGDAYEAGARMNRDNPGAFRKQAAIARGLASRASMQSTEAFHQMGDAIKEAAIPLAFALPPAGTDEPAALGKLKKGMLPVGAEAERLQNSMLNRGVVAQAARLVTPSGDTTEASKVYEQGKVARERFLASTAKSLYDQADLFGRKKLDQPRRVQMLCTEAMEALAAVPSTKETKELEAKLVKLLKATKATS